jgi:sigma-B regulation protein RsbU (phosphoserine phosphatase)
MSDVLASMRTLRPFDVDLSDLVSRLDRHVIRTTQPEHYLTLFIGEIDPVAHRLKYVNAGHPPAYLLHPDGSCQELEATGMPVGLVDLPTVTFASREVDFPAGATLVIYSDGVSEAQRGEEQFGDHRFGDVLRNRHAMSAEECAEHIENEVDRYLGDRPRTDDLTLLLLRREG